MLKVKIICNNCNSSQDKIFDKGIDVEQVESMIYTNATRTLDFLGSRNADRLRCVYCDSERLTLISSMWDKDDKS